MDLRKGEYQINLDSDEIYNLACHVFHDLRDSVNRHWNHLQQDTDGEQPFFEQEEKRGLKYLKFFCSIVGRNDVYDSWIYEIKYIFEERRKERTKTNEK